MLPIWSSLEPNFDGADDLLKGDLKSLRESLGAAGKTIPDLILRLLWMRELRGPVEIQSFLQPKLGDIKDPFKLQGMDKAVQRIIEAFEKNQKICIYADFDLDGTSGLALLWTGLRGLGFRDVQMYQPRRLSEGYGFHQEAVEDLKAQGVDLIITVDVGITAVKAVSKARELGVDVILTDHHLPLAELPPAYVIVNPNACGCPSGLGYLCGAGVAFYLLRALKRAFHERTDLPQNDFDLREVLEFFTIATLTDMVPLVEDNRVLVKAGIKALENTKKPGLRALLEELNLSGRSLTSQDVAIRFAPKLNALSRMESEILPIDIMTEESTSEAQRMIELVMTNNSDRVRIQADAEREAMKLLEGWDHEDFVFVASESFHRGVIGLIATKLSQSLNKVALVGSIGDDGMIVGSARTPPGVEISLIEVLGTGSAYLARFGGHMAAAGFEVSGQWISRWIGDLDKYFKDLKQEPKPLELKFDLQISLPNITPQFMDWYDHLGPYGISFPCPIIRINQVVVVEQRELKGGHVKLKLRDRFGSPAMDALLFSPVKRQIVFLASEFDFVDILGEVQWNYFAGKKTVQILIRDLKPSE